MNEEVRIAIERLEDTINRIKNLDRSYWNVSLGTKHLNAYAEQIVNDAKTLSAHLKNYGNQ